MHEPWRVEAQKEARRLEEDALFSARGHFEASNGWEKIHRWLGIPATLCAAFSSLAAGTAAVLTGYPVIAAVFGFIGAALIGVGSFLDSGGRVRRHHASGCALKALRTQARTYANIDVEGVPREEALSHLRRLQQEYDKVSREADRVPRRAYERARKSIEAGEADYAVDRPVSPNRKSA